MLLALVLTLSLCVNAIAEPAGGSNEPAQGTEQVQEPEQTQGTEQTQEPEQTQIPTLMQSPKAQDAPYTMEAVLAGVDELSGTLEEKEAAKTYLRQYFSVIRDEDRSFLVINNISMRWDMFIVTQSQKDYLQNTVLTAYTDEIASVLASYEIRYGQREETFAHLIEMYRSALTYPAMKNCESPDGSPDTGSVPSVEELRMTENNQSYIAECDVTNAQTYFNKYFVLKQLGDDPSDKYVDFKDEYYQDGELNTEQARAAILEYYNELSPSTAVLLNELSIHMPIPNGTECYRFWRVIELFERQLNGGGPGGSDGPDSGDGPTTGSITSVDDLPGDGPMLGKAKDFLEQYITYEYKNDAYSDIHINGVKIVNDLFDKPEVAKKAVDAYYAMVQEMEGTRTVLDNLRIRVDDQLWMFSRRMDHYAEMVKFGMSKGDPDVTTDPLMPDDVVVKMLQEGGFTPPKLGVDFTVTVPFPLERGTDYNYNYEIVDGVGILTMEVYKGDKQHWIEAGLNNPSGILYGVTTRRPADLAYHDSVCGNGGGGIWDAYAKGEIPLRHYTEPTSAHGNGLAAVNMQNGMMTVTAIENYGDMMMLSIWNDHEKMDGNKLVKHLMLARIRVVDPFSYEAETGDDAPPAVNAQDEARVKYTLHTESQWKVTRYEEQLVICPTKGTLAEQFERGQINPIGTLSITAPEGYTALASASMEMQPLPPQELTVTNGVWECSRVFPFQTYDGRAVPGTREFVLCWRNDQGDIYRETFALCFRDTGAPLLDRLKDAYTDANKGANSTPADDVVFSLQPEAIAQKAIDEVVSPGMTVIYDRERGIFHTTFDSKKGLPSLDDLDKGWVLEPSDEIRGKVTGFHVIPFEGGDPEAMDDMIFLGQMTGLKNERGDPQRTSSYPDETIDRTIPFVVTNRLERGDLTVCFSFSQDYRGMLVEWVDAQNKVLGYTFAYGRNDPFVTATRTEVTDEGPVPGVQYGEPFAVAEGGGMLRCDRYPQEGGNGQKWYFRLCVSRGDLPEGEVYTVYLPYSYLGIRDADAQKLIASGQKARIEHYADGDDMPPTIIEGTYTEWGICFKTSSFSPFVISTATAGTSSGTGSNTGTGSTTGTGSSTGTGSNTGTGSSAGSASPTTGDAGIALYVGMAVSSAVGMAWVGKKKD